MKTSRAPAVRRVRLAPEARRAQMVEAAGKVALELGYLPVSLEALSRAAGASKALIYAYFPTQHDLFNAVLARQFASLAEAGLEGASQRPTLREAAQTCALIYFEHIAAHGPLIHLILRDQFMARRVDAANRRFRDRVMLRLARLARRELKLSAKENVATLNLVTTIPEQAGALAWGGEMDRGRARELMVELVAASLRAFDEDGESARARNAARPP
jgi:AcrR family transcriptional regulator